MARAMLLCFYVMITVAGLRLIVAFMSWLWRNRKPKESIRLKIL